MAPGKNVQLVPVDPYYWKEVAPGSFDVVISGQAFEHAEFSGRPCEKSRAR